MDNTNTKPLQNEKENKFVIRKQDKFKTVMIKSNKDIRKY